MKKNYLIFILLLTLTYGVSAQTIRNKKQIDFREINLPCFFVQKLWVINNQEELDSLIALVRMPKNSNCFDLNPVPEINFEKYTLIGFGMAESGCNPPKIELDFEKIDQKILVNAKVIIQGLCRGYFTGKTWCLIPKVNIGVEFDIKVEKIYPKESE